MREEGAMDALRLYDTTSSETTLAFVRDILNSDPSREHGVEELTARLRRCGVLVFVSEVELALEALQLDGEVAA